MKKIIIILLATAGIGTGGFFYIKEKATEVVADKVIENTVKEIANEYGISETKVNEVLDQVSDEDKQTVETIVENNLNLKTVETLATGNKDEAIDYVKENLSDTDEEKLEDLYNKYAGLLK